MSNSKIPVATTIPLSPIDSEEFYAVIIQEENKRGKCNNVWLFRKGCGTAYYHTGKMADKDDSTMTIDGVKTLDTMGTFDEIKEMLLEVKE